MEVLQFLILITVVKVVILSKKELIKPSPTVMPSSEIWKRVSRKATTLKELEELVFDSTKESKTKQEAFAQSHIIRREIRAQIFVSFISYGQNDLTWITFRLLLDLKHTSLENYDQYWHYIMKLKKVYLYRMYWYG